MSVCGFKYYFNITLNLLFKKKSCTFDNLRINFFLNELFLVWSKNKSDLVRQMEIKLGRIMDWLKKSGMRVNESKTDLCLFYRGDKTPIMVTLYGQIIQSNKSINILGVIFDSKL